jgi:uncharacterized membrane protein
VLALPILLNLLFLWMEARRFRGMVLIAQRVRLLERGFYVQALGGEHLENWHRALTESLRLPAVPITYLQAFSVRLRRNYIWLLVTVYTAWLVKLDLGGRIVDSATIGSVPGTVVLTIALLTLVPLLVIAGVYHPPEEG